MGKNLANNIDEQIKCWDRLNNDEKHAVLIVLLNREYYVASQKYFQSIPQRMLDCILTHERNPSVEFGSNLVKIPKSLLSHGSIGEILFSSSHEGAHQAQYDFARRNQNTLLNPYTLALICNVNPLTSIQINGQKFTIQNYILPPSEMPVQKDLIKRTIAYNAQPCELQANAYALGRLLEFTKFFQSDQKLSKSIQEALEYHRYQSASQILFEGQAEFNGLNATSQISRLFLNINYGCHYTIDENIERLFKESQYRFLSKEEIARLIDTPLYERPQDSHNELSIDELLNDGFDIQASYIEARQQFEQEHLLDFDLSNETEKISLVLQNKTYLISKKDIDRLQWLGYEFKDYQEPSSDEREKN